MTTITLYEKMSTLAAQMAQAAAACDWDRLVLLEKECAGLASRLEAAGQTTPLAATERSRKAELIRQILADDAEVRRHTEPWMEHVREFLGGSARERTVRRAYGANAGQ